MPSNLIWRESGGRHLRIDLWYAMLMVLLGTHHWFQTVLLIFKDQKHKKELKRKKGPLMGLCTLVGIVVVVHCVKHLTAAVRCDTAAGKCNDQYFDFICTICIYISD